jgi:acetolactate synthase-1/2/3 large subunit
VAALAGAGTRLMFGVPGGGPNLDVVGAAAAGGGTFPVPGAGADAAGRGLAPLAAALRAARRPVLLLGPGALAHAAEVRDALAGSGIPALHTYRARGIMPDSGSEAAGLVTGGTMEWPLLAASDLIIGLGVDPAEMIPAARDYAARTILVAETSAGAAEAGRYFTGGTTLVAPLGAAIELIAAHRHHGGWPPAAGRTAKTSALAGLREAARAAPGLLSPQDVVTTVRAHTPPETIATVDAGAHMLVAMPLWEMDEPHRLLPARIVRRRRHRAGRGRRGGQRRGGAASELAAALNRDGPTVIDASIDPATYPAVMDLTRGEAGRHPPAGHHPGTGRHPSTGT